MQAFLTKIKNTVSGDRAFYLVREISNFHRIQASTGYRAAAKYVTSKLQADGFDVHIKSYPADGKTWFFTSKMFKEWDCKAGSLNLVNPEKCLADFNRNNLSVIQKSYPCDYRDQPLEIVLMDKGNDAKNYKAVDLKGKLLFVRDPFIDYMDWAIKERGAVGFISDFMREIPGVRARYDLHDILNYTSFWWKHSTDEPQAFGFVLTPRDGDELAKLCREMKQEHEKDPAKDEYPKATCYIDAKLYEGEIEVVETLLPGDTDEEVLIVAHLCHPRSSANDNASGVAASIEAVKAIKELTERGALPGLKRSIRMIFVPEFTGTYAYLHDLGEKRSKIKAGFNMDMVGARQTNGYGPITISGIPHATPSFCVDLAALVLDEVKKNALSLNKDAYVAMFNTAVIGFEGGSDHFILSDPTIHIPTPMLGEWPDINYHTGGDTIEVIDPFILHKSASICAGYIYSLANLSEEEVPLIMNKTRERFTGVLARWTQAAAEKEASLKETYEQFQHNLNYFKECNESFKGFFREESANARISRCIERENSRLDKIASDLWADFIEDYGLGYVYESDEVPQKYSYVPVRKYIAPLNHMDDFAIDDPRRMKDYKAYEKDHRSKLRSAHTFDAIVQFYMDGKRSLWEIAKQAMLETHDGSVEYVHEFVQLLKSFGLVDIKGEKND